MCRSPFRHGSTAVVLCFLSIVAISLGISRPLAAADAWEWKTRDTWQRPQEVMDALDLKNGSAVADVGCGDGYFTFRLAERVGTAGKVYAVDIKASDIKKIRKQAAKEKLPQIAALVGDGDDPHLPPGALDAILVVKAYHEFTAYDAMLGHFLAALKPGGKFGVIDYIADPGKPRADYEEHHRIPPELVQQEVERDKFQLLRREGDIPIPDDSRKMFFLIFERPLESAPGK
jgi:predicted methyltransferase